MIKILTDAYKLTNSKTVSKLYKGLQKWNGRNTFYVNSKWEAELNINLSADEWRSSSSTQKTSTPHSPFFLFVYVYAWVLLTEKLINIKEKKSFANAGMHLFLPQ